ncbi:UDP-glucoronosyl and UDP-glucosyl transferase [compost metagenome]
MEGIRANVPLLISPICNDQFHQAYFVEKSGVGRSLDLRTASREEIRQAMEGLLSDQNIKASMKRVSETYQDNGSLKAARLIQDAVKKAQKIAIKL